MNRQEKKQLVEKIVEICKSSNSLIMTHYQGLTVAQTTDLRKVLRDNGASFVVLKNTLFRIAAKEAGINHDPAMFKGPTGIAYSADPVAAAKCVVKFAKANDNLKIIGGVVNDKILNVSEIETLSKLPSLDEIRGQMVGLLQAPATNIARILSVPAAQVARVIQAYADKG